MKNLLLTAIMLFLSLSVSANDELVLSNFLSTQFELDQFRILSSKFNGACSKDGIRDNIYANGPRELRTGAEDIRSYFFFDDLSKCMKLNFNIIKFKKLDLKRNMIEISLYKAAWSKQFGFKPVRINSIYKNMNMTGNCSITKHGLVFKNIHIDCNLYDNEGKLTGSLRLREK